VTTTTEQLSPVTVEMVLEGEPVSEGNGRGEEEKRPVIYTVEPAQTLHTVTYEGPAVKVFPEVHWQNPEHGPYCSHIQELLECEKVPLTAKANVAVKLSKQYDPHLACEAENYQSFPAHLFEHWNGYNVIPPLHDPVPSQYLSPILLLENCGIPIDAEALNQDDKHECASLLYRFHEAGWIHGSYSERNVVMQLGPLNHWPLCRSVSDVRSFRLIDFGRSTECDGYSRAAEEMDADRMFRTFS